jgi:ABC-type antimicrobial peptide transport system permease subunit
MTGMDLAVGPDGTRFTTIVGVVADLRARDPSVPPEPQVYMPYEQHPFFSTQLTLLVRTTGDPLLVAPAVQQRIRALNADVPSKIGTMDDAMGVAISAPRFRTVLLGLFAALALVLAMAGVYGIVAYSVSQRAGEMGLRMALGAQRSAIVRLTLSSGLRLTAVGVGIGWAIALAFSRVLSSMLFEVPERDPIAFAVAPVLLVGVATLASLVPALNASRVDPSVALRAG